MNENRVVPLRQPDEIDDPLTEILRCGAKRLVQQAVEAEFAAFLAMHADLELPDGRQRVVRHGHDPARPIQTGIGPVEVSKPKARDPRATRADERIRYRRRFAEMGSADEEPRHSSAGSLSARRFHWRLSGRPDGLARQGTPNLSPSVIGRLKSDWEDDYRRWQASDLSARRYVYVWADGVYLQARMEPQAECILVLIGATPEGKRSFWACRRACGKAARAGRNCLSI